ncbi:MAG TPA: aldose epimerase family protein [Tenuifilaceae bacterium]|nr:aldose epimerase family protein [Tenuifilaceae bacterium]HPQ34815.1 aldose epimerase family protein [Tenuifilaceae bacterium]
MKVNVSEFGKLANGSAVSLFSFQAKKGLAVKISNYGGIITSIQIPDKYGVVDEIVAGFPTLNQYLQGHPHFGVIVGRFANRIANGKFVIDYKEFNLPINNGENHLHGGNNGFHTKLWDYNLTEYEDYAKLKLNLMSPHLDEGYPGNLEVSVTYIIYDNNELHIEFVAATDEPTHVNLTSHGYFNLSGFKNDIFDHKLLLDAYAYLPVDEHQIPTGDIKRWDETPFDFSKPYSLGKKLDAIEGGIDNCFALKQPRSLTKSAAKLIHEKSGRWLKIYCTQPGIQIYTGNSLDGSLVGHNGTRYNKHSAVCLETQHFPDSPNKPNFPITLLMPDEEYSHQVRYAFGTSS